MKKKGDLEPVRFNQVQNNKMKKIIKKNIIKSLIK